MNIKLNNLIAIFDEWALFMNELMHRRAPMPAGVEAELMRLRQRLYAISDPAVADVANVPNREVVELLRGLEDYLAACIKLAPPRSSDVERFTKLRDRMRHAGGDDNRL